MSTAATATARESEFKVVGIEQLHESKTNPRRAFPKDALSDLTKSIAEKGVLVPLLVRRIAGNISARPDSSSVEIDGIEYDSYFEILAGARRYRASKDAGLTKLPVLIRELDDTQALEVQVIENLQRADIHPLEEAEGYKQLLEKGKYDVDALAAKVGKSASYVYQRLKLVELIPAAAKAFPEEKITAGHAILLARLQPKDQERGLKESKRYNDEYGSVRDLARWIKDNVHLVLKNAAFPLDDSGRAHSGLQSSKVVTGAKACVDCPKRSGANPQLFSDIQGEDVCTDPKCFHAKEEKFVELLVSMHPGRKQLSAGNYYGEKPEGLTGWTSIGKKACKDTIDGVVVEIARYSGSEFKLGQMLKVCTNGRCKVHHKQQRGQSTASSMSSRETPAQKAKRQAADQARELQRTADCKALELLVDKKKTLGRLELQIIAVKLYSSAGRMEFIDKRFGWKNGLSYSNEHKQISKLNADQLDRLLIALAFEDILEGYTEKHVMAGFEAECRAVKIDRNAIAKELKASGVNPGTCRYCGCTDKKACKPPCSWVDDSETICSNPKCVAAAKKAKAA